MKRRTSSPSKSDQPKAEHRVIVHLDLDCFYAQVETRRLGLPQEAPLAVQQWGALLAVNYPARKFGISRSEPSWEAKRKCPDLHLPHVDTLGENRSGKLFDRANQMAFLQRYRDASKEIFDVLRKRAPICEKGSVDEAYLDISDLAAERLKRQNPKTDDSLLSDYCLDSQNSDTKVFGVSNDQEILSGSFPLNHQEQLLCAGATIAREIRQEIFQTLGFTSSTGIAPNKLLAKLASPMNKPNGQMVISPRFLTSFMATYPIRQIRGLGGKLGKQLEEIYLSHFSSSSTNESDKAQVTAQALVDNLTLEDLSSSIGPKAAAFALRVCRGDDGDEPVDWTKSFMRVINVMKLFRQTPALTTMQQLEYWIHLLSNAVLLRVEKEKVDNGRFPTKVILECGCANVSKSPPIRMPFSQTSTKDTLAAAALSALESRGQDQLLPCVSLAMSLKDFVELDGGKSNSSITSFFSTKTLPSDGSKGEEHPMEEEFKTMNQIMGSKQNGSKESTIARFLLSNEQTAVDLKEQAERKVEGEGFYCDECRRQIHVPREEHSDYHVAVALSRGQRTQSQASALNSKPTKKRKVGPLDAFLRQGK